MTTNYNRHRDTMVSGYCPNFLVGTKITSLRTGRGADLVGLVDSGCTRSLMHPAIVMGLRVGRLKNPVNFTQLDGTDMQGGPVQFYTLRQWK